MRILALNSSARTGGQSKTEMMLTPLVEGMREAGAEVDVVNLREKKIEVCVGCLTCWTKTPGQCVHQDDMTKELFPKWLAADICVYATPLFYHTVNATMKVFMERTLPINEPFLLKGEKRWIHPLRHRHPGVVILSVAGFPEMSAFDGLSHYVKFCFGVEEKSLLAEIYRPGSEYMNYAGERRDDILEATKAAGNELVKYRRVDPETLARIEQPLADNPEDFSEMANCMWQTCITEGITRRKFEKDGVVPRPDSIKTFMTILNVGFNPEGAKDTKALLQFDFSGQVEGSCHFIIANGTMKAEDGPAETPDLTIKTPFDIWMDITTGRADGGQMFIEGKYKAEGDMDLFFNMSKFFGQNR